MNEAKALEVMVNYQVMLKQIQGLRKDLEEVHAGTAQYGLQAAMPKASGTSDIVHSNFVKRERTHKMLDKMQQQTDMIKMFCDSPEFDRMDIFKKLILEYLMAGMKQCDIAIELEFSEATVSRYKKEIALNISNFVHNVKDMKDVSII